jgi:EAL domain-containing protein (putative c-di-GMP-specific phosphodiesterase class I)
MTGSRPKAAVLIRPRIVSSIHHDKVSANEMHLRRVRRVQLLGSAMTALVGTIWGTFFVFRHDWLIVGLDMVAIAMSALCVAMVQRDMLRQATLLYMAVVYTLLCFTSALIDIPTPAVPRSMHLFLLPMAACSCLLLRNERPWLRHGFPLLCLATFTLFDCTNAHLESPWALPDSIRSYGIWVDQSLSLLSLYGGITVIVADVAARSGAELELRNALIRGELLLHYQPQVCEDGTVIGAEALVRWRHPFRGLVPPNDFIPLAESSGLMIPLGDWVMRAACQQLARWQFHPALRDIPIAVNVSASQFAEPGFVQRVLAILQDTGARASVLKLELTESALAEDIDDVTCKMAELKRHGVRFSLDDFGTGFSSLSYLRKLPLDQLKIDQSFVRNILRSNEDASIARTVVDLGNSLGLEVIAEGVETIEHRRFLAGIGCVRYQGYLFSKPLPIATFESFVEEGGPDSVEKAPDASMALA